MKRALAAMIMMVLPAWSLSRGSEVQETSVTDDPLPPLLTRLDRVAHLYRDAALKFSCREKIIHARPGTPSLFHEFEYIYEFSDVSGLLDFRIDRNAPRRADEAPRRAYLSDYDLPYFLTRGYSWIFLLDRAHQERHKYSLGAVTRVLGRPAIPVAFEPIPPFENDVNDWFGTLWVDAESLQPLRAEAMKRFEREQEAAFRNAVKSTASAWREDWVFARVQTEFTQEQNGMRFPGKVTITGVRGRIAIRRGKRVAEEQTLFTVTQVYTNYHFFSVRTREAIQSIGRAGADR